MASLLDAVSILGELGIVTVIIVAVLVWAIIFGILTKYGPFGDKMPINVIISTAVAFIFVYFIQAARWLQYMVPFVVGTLVVLLFIFLILRFAGISEGDIAGALKKSFVGYGVIIFVIIIFALLSFQYAFPQLTKIDQVGACEMDPAEGAELVNMPEWQLRQQCEFTRVLFNPAVIGIMIMLAIFAVATYLIAKP